MTGFVPIESINYTVAVTVIEDLAVSEDDARAFLVHLPVDIQQGPIAVGKVHALLLRVEAAAASGYGVAELFDSVDQDLHELYDAVFDHATEELREDLVEPSGRSNVLVVRAAKVIASRRGAKLALVAVQRLRDFFGDGCAAIVLKAQPLHPDSTFADAIDREVFATNHPYDGDAAKSRLRAYWADLGFKRVGETDYMIFDMGDQAPVVTLGAPQGRSAT